MGKGEVLAVASLMAVLKVSLYRSLHQTFDVPHITICVAALPRQVPLVLLHVHCTVDVACQERHKIKRRRCLMRAPSYLAPTGSFASSLRKEGLGESAWFFAM